MANAMETARNKGIPVLCRRLLISLHRERIARAMRENRVVILVGGWDPASRCRSCNSSWRTRRRRSDRRRRWQRRSLLSARRHLGTATAMTITKTTTIHCGHRAPTHCGRVPRPLHCRGEGMTPPWRCEELCGVHGPQRQVGASPFLSDHTHDDWDPAEDARVGSSKSGGGGGRRQQRRLVVWRQQR